MNILIIGSGGREHALSWKCAQDNFVKNVFVCPGYAGTYLENKVSNVEMDSNDFDAIEKFCVKENIRILKIDMAEDNPYPGTLKKISGGILVQDDDNGNISIEDLRCVTKRKPSEAELKDMMFAWKVAKFIKSNAIVYVKNKQTIGIGAGQMSRVISAEIANLKAAEEGLEVKNAVMASDAFFPFRDGIDKAASSGITAIIQPGGSIKDEEVIAAANEHGIAMVFTGMRHFRH